jgi:large subunit ribosomal protein L5
MHHSFKKTNEFLRKFNLFFQYKNIGEVPNVVDKVTLVMTLSKNASFKNIVKAFALLELISGFRPFFVRSKKSSIFLKLRKGNPIGVKLTLRKKRANLLFLKFVWSVLPKIKELGLNCNLRKHFDRNAVLSFKIKDPFVFSELKNFYFFFKEVGDLTVVISFKKTNLKEETFFQSRLLQLPFNKSYPTL